MSIWGELFTAVLGGIAEDSRQDSAERQTREATREAGTQNRLTSQFNAEQDYYYNQVLRHEKKRALDSGYSPFSTVKEFAPNYAGSTGLDAIPDKPRATREYDGT